MPVPSTEDILNISSDHVSQFISDQANSRTLSVVMRRLNEELMSPDQSASDLARQALERLGFSEYA